MPQTEKQKEQTKQWKLNNKERVREHNRNGVKAFYYRNKEAIALKEKNTYQYEKICKIFRNILL